jgi:hypothetical protein
MRARLARGWSSAAFEANARDSFDAVASMAFLRIMNATVRENGRMRWPIAWGFPHHALRTYLHQPDQKVLLGALSARIRQLSHGS